MKSNPGADVFVILRSLRRRLFVREFLDALAAGALLATGLIVLLLGIHRWWPVPAALLGLNAIIVLSGLVAVGALLIAARQRSLAEMAMLADARGETRDRLITALGLAQNPPAPGALAELAQAECAAYLERTDFRPLIPLHPPRLGTWLVVPMTALVLLQFDATQRRLAAAAEAEQAQAAVAETVQRIEQLAKEARQADQKKPDEDLKKLAEELQKSAERLRAETRPEEASKSALRELSSLEEMMRELQRQPSLPDEMKELAKALGQLPGMQDVLKALNENNLAEAQKALEEARQKQEKDPAKAPEEQVKQTLQEAMQRLGERRRLSSALQKLAEQMQQQGGQLSQQAMQQLAHMLQQAQKDGGQKQSGDSSGSQNQMTLQEMIAALENMKFGDGQQGDQKGGKEGQKGGGNGQQVSVQSFGQPGAPEDKGDPSGNPSGNPGSERDFGTTATPFGERNANQDKGGELGLKGQLSQGETLSMMLPSAGDQSRAARRYKDLYEAAAASAQDAVQQENIPLGSRFLIKRYFESIRPQE